METSRVQEIVDSIDAFKKDTYSREEILSEMLKLQDEVLRITFEGQERNEYQNRLVDAGNELERRCLSLMGRVNNEFEAFKYSSKNLSNLIAADLSGRAGEKKAFDMLNNLRGNYYILKNIELSKDGEKTEIDAMVISSSGISIVEVKNTKRDIFIDYNGDYYRNSDYLHLDCNIAEKLTLREELIRKALSGAGYGEIPIQKILLFTNNRINVENRRKEINPCFLAQLTYTIEKFHTDAYLSVQEMGDIKKILLDEKNYSEYIPEFDTNRFKTEFAELLYSIETLEKNRNMFVVENRDHDEKPIDNKLEIQHDAEDIKKLSPFVILPMSLILGGIPTLFINRKIKRTA